jgi:hypothetical protein
LSLPPCRRLDLNLCSNLDLNLDLDLFFNLNLGFNPALFLNSFCDSFPTLSRCMSLASSPAK